MAYNCKATFERSQLQGKRTYKPKIVTDYWERVFDVDFASFDCAIEYAQEECESIRRVHKLSRGE